MQGTWVRAMVQEDPTCHGATKPMHHNYWACALEPTGHNYWAHEPQLLSPRATTTEARGPRARAPQQEKPLQWEARTPQRRVARAHCNWRKPTCSNEDPMQPEIKKTKKHMSTFAYCYWWIWIDYLYSALSHNIPLWWTWTEECFHRWTSPPRPCHYNKGVVHPSEVHPTF